MGRYCWPDAVHGKMTLIADKLGVLTHRGLLASSALIHLGLELNGLALIVLKLCLKILDGIFQLQRTNSY